VRGEGPRVRDEGSRVCRGGFMNSMTILLEIRSNPPSSLEM
jgi:hypothetical protein